MSDKERGKINASSAICEGNTDKKATYGGKGFQYLQFLNHSPIFQTRSCFHVGDLPHLPDQPGHDHRQEAVRVREPDPGPVPKPVPGLVQDFPIIQMTTCRLHNRTTFQNLFKL